ncbi:hypothetical protein AB4140_19115 [Shewanella sp. 10N.286.51.B2]|uniref:hypothetical protein n=1 Tax=Shewanella sp. 10N.286.51.B2 TaxID=3229707 RepID=UPI003553147A
MENRFLAGKLDKVDKAFHFFSDKHNLKSDFSLIEIEKATGWGASTVKTYVTKRWGSFFNKVQ